jgi:extracellular elastinolytic metalloproteinase
MPSPSSITDKSPRSSSAGIRSHPYSTSKTVNPYTYATLKTKSEVHDIGEVWANTMVNVYAALVAAKGFDTGAKTSATGTGGNTAFLHLLLDGMALQPCNPTFLTARDAIIQADANRYAGANKCTLWKAFASRGLGTAAASRTDSSAVPSGC